MLALKSFRPVAIVALLAAVPAVAQEGAQEGRPPALRALIQKYRCPIYDRLERVHDWGAPSSHHNRFISVSVPGGYYVQCLFHDDTRKLYCEGASGFYEAKPGAARTAHLPATAIAGLAKLGFSTDDSAGNFSLDRDIGAEPDYTALADLILAALHAGYGATADMDLKIDAPFAPGPGSSCVPLG